MYKLASKDHCKETIVNLGPAPIGDGRFAVIAGPCAVEDREQIESTARFIRERGAVGLRGGAYKPRTSPYSFQGLGDEGVELIARAAVRFRIPCVVEALAEGHVALLAGHAGMIQIGARNMQNFALLKAAARTGLPVLLKRSAAATLGELLCAAEYVLLEGNGNVVLCERGIRGFDSETRNVFDLAGALRLKELTHLPVIVDPSHATGRASLVAPLVLAAAAAGLDGAIVEVHPNPAVARSDAEQAMDFPAFEAMMNRLRAIVELPLSEPAVAV